MNQMLCNRLPLDASVLAVSQRIFLMLFHRVRSDFTFFFEEGRSNFKRQNSSKFAVFLFISRSRHWYSKSFRLSPFQQVCTERKRLENMISQTISTSLPDLNSFAISLTTLRDFRSSARKVLISVQLRLYLSASRPHLTNSNYRQRPKLF